MIEPARENSPAHPAIVSAEAERWDAPARFAEVDADENDDTTPTLLIAEDDPHSGRTLQDYFEAKGFNAIWAANGVEAIKAFRETRVDLALVDIMMPGVDGYEVCRTIKSESLDRSVPVIFVTAKAFPEDQAAGFDSEADGYVTKPYDLAALRAEVDARLRIKTRLDTLRREKKVLDRLSKIDPLTGLPNRRFFEERLIYELQRADRYEQDLALLMIDVDHFKQANDAYGHLFGDSVLKEVAAILGGVGRDVDIPARFGGDEFSVILPAADAMAAERLAERLRSAVETHVFSLPDPASKEDAVKSVQRITLTIGVAAITRSQFPEDPSEFIDWADKALYKAKAMGRNCVASFSGGQIIPFPAA